jgi:hypothetical protein
MRRRNVVIFGVFLTITIAAALVVLTSPFPSVTNSERAEHQKRALLVKKLHDLNDARLIDGIKNRQDLIKLIIESKVLSQDELNELADARCQNTNTLFGDGIYFWKSMDNSFSVLSRNWTLILHDKKIFSRIIDHAEKEKDPFAPNK